MSKERLDPPRQSWETADYQEDPFELGEIDDAKFVIVNDFLPRPEDLVFKEAKPKAKKITMVLDDFTIDFFKEKAQELGAPYQAMIRKLLFEYARKNKADEHN